MADSLTVIPHAVARTDEGLRSWLTTHGVRTPAEDALGRVPTIDQLKAILDKLEFPYSPTVDGFMEGQYSDGNWAPFSTLKVIRGPGGTAESMSFRLGPLEGPFEIIRRVSTLCGAQVAMSHSNSVPVLVESGTTWHEFSSRLTSA